MDQVSISKKIHSPVGDLWVTATEKGICGVSNKSSARKKGVVSAKAEKWLKQAEKELNEYFSGKRKEFHLPLDLEGTPFQLRVWKAIASTPYAWTISYKDLARKVGNADAVRAAGTACGANPVLILIPCHRILTSDGGLGGFAAGLRVKKWLLAMEEASTVQIRVTPVREARSQTRRATRR